MEKTKTEKNIYFTNNGDDNDEMRIDRIHFRIDRFTFC